MDLPTSIRAFKPDEFAWRYVNPTALDPAAPYGGWDPTDHFLSFETLTITPQTMGNRVTSGPGRVHGSFDRPLAQISRDMDDVRRDIVEKLVQDGYVADQRGPEIEFEYTVTVRVKAWPAVPGVTVPDESKRRGR